MSISASPEGATYAALFGPVFWGFCAALILCGVTLVQAYLYFTRYNDKRHILAVAITMLLLDLVSMALICQSMYYYMLPFYGSLEPLGAVTKELTVECLISAVITFISQMYFVYQLQIIHSRSMVMTAMTLGIVFLGVVGLAGATGCVVLMFMHPESIFMNRNPTFVVLAGIAKGFGAAADIVATIAMCLFLKSVDTGISRTSSILKSLIHLTINRGLLVTLAQILLLIVFFSSAGHLYWLAVHVNTTKLYVNTFFGMLNARSSLLDRGHSQVETIGSFRTTTTESRSRKPDDMENKEYPLGVKVTKTSRVTDF